MYVSWDIEYKRQYFVIWVIFCSLPHYWPENLKLWENGKIPGRIISLNLCITIDDHMIYGSRDTEHDRYNFLSSWTVIYLLTTRKIKILKKWKNFLAKLSFYTCLQLMKITWCAVREIGRMTDRIFCRYGPFFVLLVPPSPITTQKINEKSVWRYHNFMQVYQKSWSLARYTVPEIWCVKDVVVIFHFGLFFALLRNSRKFEKSKFIKNEKTSRDIIILHKCTKNHVHMIWDMLCDGWHTIEPGTPEHGTTECGTTAE